MIDANILKQVLIDQHDITLPSQFVGRDVYISWRGFPGPRIAAEEAR